MINVEIIGGRLRLEWSYSESVHRRATLERLLQDYRDTLLALVGGGGA